MDILGYSSYASKVYPVYPVCYKSMTYGVLRLMSPILVDVIASLSLNCVFVSPFVIILVTTTIRNVSLAPWLYFALVILTW